MHTSSACVVSVTRPLSAMNDSACSSRARDDVSSRCETGEGRGYRGGIEADLCDDDVLVCFREGFVEREGKQRRVQRPRVLAHEHQVCCFNQHFNGGQRDAAGECAGCVGVKGGDDVRGGGCGGRGGWMREKRKGGGEDA